MYVKTTWQWWKSPLTSMNYKSTFSGGCSCHCLEYWKGTINPGSRCHHFKKTVGFLWDDSKPLLQKIKNGGGWTGEDWHLASKVAPFRCMIAAICQQKWIKSFTYSAISGHEKKSLNFIFPTKYVIPKV